MDFIEKVSYKVNRDDNIIDVSNDWAKAATVGKAETIIEANQVVGRPLLDFVMGEATKMYYRVIFGKCRRLRKAQKIEYRCDSPTHKRFMEMDIKPGPGETLTIDNYLLKEEPFDNHVNIYEDVNYNIKNPVQRCSICNGLKLTANSDWITPEELAKEQKREFVVVHTVCPSCEEKGW